MTRRKDKARELVRACTYIPAPPGICENCRQLLADESAHCPATSYCVDECPCDEHNSDRSA